MRRSVDVVRTWTAAFGRLPQDAAGVDRQTGWIRCSPRRTCSYAIGARPLDQRIPR
ncbi:hypothetical protein KTR9_3627 [Gordonia sp. KTR9]|nr:hypothetical protein KTR9_3627 [Gordonia sp. KTR9]